VVLVGNCMYKHEAIHINFTTYDMCCKQDSINIHSHPYVMTLAHENEEDKNNWHPYWYAKVLRIFHVNIRLSDSSETEKMDFLWVHWFGQDPDYRGGLEAHHLHHVGLMDPRDPSSYSFLNPSNMLRAVHLIPAFLTGRLASDPEADEDNMDWEFYYMSMYIFLIFRSHMLTDTWI
jgi:hypothetical protein